MIDSNDLKIDQESIYAQRRRFLGLGLALPAALAFSSRIARAQSTSNFDYYISPSGSNANAGTISSPWSLTALQTKSQIAGKRVGLLDGLYVVTNLGGLSANNNDPLIAIGFGGTAASPTVIEAVNPRMVTLTTNNGGVYLSGTYPLMGIPATSNYVEVRGITFSDLSFTALTIKGSHILIENCEISNIVAARNPLFLGGDNCGGINTGGYGTDLTIRNCYIHDIYNSGTSAGTNNGCIGPLYFYSNIVVEFCTLEGSGHAVGPKREVGQVTAHHNFIRNQQSYAFRGMLDQDMSMSPVGGAYHHNVIVNVPNIYGSEDPQTGMVPRTTDFFSNTVIFSSGISGATAGLIHWNGPNNASGIQTSNRYYNNILLLPSGLGRPNNGIMFWYTATNNQASKRLALCNYNCYGLQAAQFRMKDSTGTYDSLSAWAAATGFDSRSLVGDPLLKSMTSSSAADFALQPQSPCVNAGRVGGASTGVSVDVGAWDVGTQQIGHNFGVQSIRPKAPIVNVT